MMTGGVWTVVELKEDRTEDVLSQWIPERSPKYLWEGVSGGGHESEEGGRIVTKTSVQEVTLVVQTCQLENR